MLDTTDVDVLIIEDMLPEVERIRTWLNLGPATTQSQLVPASPAEGNARLTMPATVSIRPADLATQSRLNWQAVEKKIAETNPLVVVFDYLLADENGAQFARHAKQRWPRLGVILVSTGGDGELEGVLLKQHEADEALDNMDANQGRPDCFWIKPWGRARADRPYDQVSRAMHLDYRGKVRELLRASTRPKTH